jgi:hypothetical protein
MDVSDNWTFEERVADQYRHLVLLGSKGMTQAYPTVPPQDPGDFYSREEALANAKLAANAPAMLRLLNQVVRSLEILKLTEAGAGYLLEEVAGGLRDMEQRGRVLEVELTA